MAQSPCQQILVPVRPPLFPPVSDPSWQLLTAPLLRYCRQHPHTIVEIVDWGRCQRFSGSLIRHMLAWLSFTQKVHYNVATKRWRVGAEPAKIMDSTDEVPTFDENEEESL